MIDGLAGTAGVAALGAAGAGGDFDAVLGGRIYHLEELAGDSAGEVRAAVEIWLRSSSGEELWSVTLAGSEAGSFSDGDDVARALHRVFEGLVAEARRGLREALETAGG